MAAVIRGLSKLPKTALIRSFSCSSSKLASGTKHIDMETHTGQVWDKEDYRRSRFVDRDKLVVENFAIDLIAEDPIVVCTQRNVTSNGGGALGHPKVYINLDKPEVGVCGYSGRKFILKKYYNEAEHGPSITYEEYMKEEKS